MLLLLQAPIQHARDLLPSWVAFDCTFLAIRCSDISVQEVNNHHSSNQNKNSYIRVTVGTTVIIRKKTGISNNRNNSNN